MKSVARLIFCVLLMQFSCSGSETQRFLNGVKDIKASGQEVHDIWEKDVQSLDGKVQKNLKTGTTMGIILLCLGGVGGSLQAYLNNNDPNSGKSTSIILPVLTMGAGIIQLVITPKDRVKDYIKESRTYYRAWEDSKVKTKDDLDKLLTGLERVRNDYHYGHFKLPPPK